jgi:UDP-glucuronate 4-epimerase
MAYYSFTKNIIENKTIELFNNGDLKRDFTYVDDIVEAIDKLLIKIPNSPNEPPHTIFNIGNQHPVGVLKFVNILESLLAKKAIIEMKPMQAGDVEITYSDTNDLEQLIDFKPNTPLEIGLERFVNWYKKFYK